jgi:hypothetical protein
MLMGADQESSREFANRYESKTKTMIRVFRVDSWLILLLLAFIGVHLGLNRLG